MSDGVQLSLLEHADLLGRYRYFELSLFGLCGERCLELEGAARRWCSAAARAHAWRAQCFEALAPVSVGLPNAASSTAPAGPAQLAALEHLAGAQPAMFLSGLVNACYPAMAHAYGERLVSCHPASDAPLRRVLQRVIADLNAVRTEGAELAGGDEVDTFGHRLATHFAESGGPFGPLTRNDAPSVTAQALP
ncbi:MAG: hypothetical protein M0014_05050 [Actinomycetota bacterium]|nr:hypothetical protein [Actinomycetota bacterium]